MGARHPCPLDPAHLRLWIRDVTAYLGIESPEKRCGKTTLLAVLGELVNRPVAAANISSPAFFRVIEESQPTLLIDEADTFLSGNDELRGILNSGYTRNTAYVVRVGDWTTADRPPAHADAQPDNAAPARILRAAPASPGSPAGARKSWPPSAACPTPSPIAASSSACNAKPLAKPCDRLRDARPPLRSRPATAMRPVRRRSRR